MRCILTISLLLLAHSVVGQNNYRAGYFAGAPGDDPSTNGELLLAVAGDTLTYRAALNNAIDVTGVHLHLQGNSSGGLFGGPLLLALTNTTTANGQSPVSSSSGVELVQEGTKTGYDLQVNPMRPMVQARLVAIGQPGSPPNTIAELVKLIDLGLVYTDVHTVKRVSPQGLTRGRVEKVAAAEHKSAPAEHVPAPVEHQPAPVEHQPAPVEHQPAPVEHQPAPVEHQPAPVEHQPAPVEHKPAPAEHQPAPIYPHPAYPAPEHKPSYPAPEHKPSYPAPEHKPVYPSPEHKPVPPSPEHKPVSPPPEHKPVSPSPEPHHVPAGGDASANANAEAIANGGNAEANANAVAQSNGGDATANANSLAQSTGGNALANSQAQAVAGRKLFLLG